MTLLDRARTNDSGAWERLVQLYTPLVYHWCKRWGVGPGDADDVVQEVFRATASSLKTFRRDRPGDTFRGWMRGITRHVILKFYQQFAKQPKARGGTDAFLRIQEIAEDAEPEDDNQAEATALYRRALELVRSEFEEKTWQMFWAVAVDDRAPADVAAEMGVTPATVRKAKSRILRRLKEEVGDLLA